MLARLAHDPNIRAQPNDSPFKSTARMRLAQAHDVTESNFQRHSVDIITYKQGNRETSDKATGIKETSRQGDLSTCFLVYLYSV